MCSRAWLGGRVWTGIESTVGGWGWAWRMPDPVGRRGGEKCGPRAVLIFYGWDRVEDYGNGGLLSWPCEELIK